MLKIKIQGTPNPLARKYILSKDVKSEGKVSYNDPKQCEHVPLACELLAVEGVVQTHFFENVITVTQNGNFDWEDLDIQIQQVIDTGMVCHDPDFLNSLEIESEDQGPKDPELQKIDAILDRTVRPHLQMDGGDLETVSLDDNILIIRYMGACGGCPSAAAGTLAAITSVLQDEYSEDLEVVTL